ncbi:oxidoreductase [Burkholderia singularis]|uniref:Oxidoreductase n=1 Tax=Burkholderia singularis TaxID=1503053 RepID=A0A124P8V6_9BURK|nr:oxidoreductase [Burkholderia singularis]KVE26544.1 oxidoreductase [Burkholderia singularis]
MSSTLKIGLMGFGFAGATFHAPVIAHSGRTHIAAIATGQPQRAQAAYPGVAVVPDFDALAALDDVECIVIATPNDTHFDLAKRALEAGKHVVVDKPVTLTAADALALARLAVARERVFAPFHNRRWDGDFLTLRKLIESGELGRITYFESHFDRFRPQVRTRWREEAARGGGLLFDLGPHLIDQALVLFGAPDTVSASIKTRRDGGNAADFVHLLLGYPDKEVVLHASALAAIEPARFTVLGTQGGYQKYGLDTQEDQLKAGLTPDDVPFGGGNPPGVLRGLDGELEVERPVPTLDGQYAEFYRALAASIHDGAPVPVAAQDAVDVMTVIELAERSEREGRRVPFVRATI